MKEFGINERGRTLHMHGKAGCLVAGVISQNSLIITP